MKIIPFSLFASKHCCALVFLLFCSASQAESPHLDVNDVSFLWPVPNTPQEVSALLSAELKLDSGEDIWPADLFDQVIAGAKTAQVIGADGLAKKISISTAITTRKNWKIAGIRIHPSSLGTSDAHVGMFGSAASLRLIMQPVETKGNRVIVHDFAAHVVFTFITNPPTSPVPSIPDEKAFGGIVDDLRAIKAKLAAAGVDTTGQKLSVHPGFEGNVPGFQEDVAALLKKHLKKSRLGVVSFMGIRTPEPWIFFSMGRGLDGRMATKPVKGNFGSSQKPMAQMFFVRIRDNMISPEPVAVPNDPATLSTAPLFKSNVEQKLGLQALPGASGENKKIKFRDIPDRIANPDLHHNFNTDCMSCHSESTRRRDLSLPASKFAFKQPEGISGLDENMLPAAESLSWNVRNFGWFPDFFQGKTVATITQRSANEAMASADFINRTAGKEPAEDPPTHRVANPLTLVVEVKSPEDRKKLKAKLEHMQSLPASLNPSLKALDSIGIVHFARFVFIGDDKIAVITAYDGNLERYVGAFAEHMGSTFDLLLKHVKDAPPLPVVENQDEFLEFILKHDLQCIEPFYSAYPSLSVGDIRAMQNRAEQE